MPRFVVPPLGGRFVGFRLKAALQTAFALLCLPAAYGQLIVELPFNAGVPAREMRSSEVERLDLKPLRDVQASSEIRPPPNQRLGVKPLHPSANASTTNEAPRPVVPVLVRPVETVFSLLGPIASLTPASTERVAFISLPSAPPPEPIVISSFDGTVASGGIRTNTTWVGQVTQGAGYITIGGSARDDNGWGSTGLSLNATGLNTLTVTAQRDAGNAGGWLFLQFEDHRLTTSVFSLSSLLFAVGAPTQVQIVLGVWSSGFDFTQITGWSIGGGGLGTQDFRMTLHDVSLSATAIPEPATVAGLMGLAALGAGVWRRRSLKSRVRGASKPPSF